MQWVLFKALTHWKYQWTTHLVIFDKEHLHSALFTVDIDNRIDDPGWLARICRWGQVARRWIDIELRGRFSSFRRTVRGYWTVQSVQTNDRLFQQFERPEPRYRSRRSSVGGWYVVGVYGVHVHVDEWFGIAADRHLQQRRHQAAERHFKNP